MDSFILEHFRDGANKRVRILDRHAGYKLKHLEIRHDGAEDLLVLDLSRHNRVMNTFGFERLDQFAKLAQRHPMYSIGMLLNLRECLFLDGRNDHLDSLAARRLEHEERKPSVSGNESVFT